MNSLTPAEHHGLLSVLTFLGGLENRGFPCESLRGDIASAFALGPPPLPDADLDAGDLSLQHCPCCPESVKFESLVGSLDSRGFFKTGERKQQRAAAWRGFVARRRAKDGFCGGIVQLRPSGHDGRVCGAAGMGGAASAVGGSGGGAAEAEVTGDGVALGAVAADAAAHFGGGRGSGSSRSASGGGGGASGGGGGGGGETDNQLHGNTNVGGAGSGERRPASSGSTGSRDGGFHPPSSNTAPTRSPPTSRRSPPPTHPPLPLPMGPPPTGGRPPGPPPPGAGSSRGGPFSGPAGGPPGGPPGTARGGHDGGYGYSGYGYGGSSTARGFGGSATARGFGSGGNTAYGGSASARGYHGSGAVTARGYASGAATFRGEGGQQPLSTARVGRWRSPLEQLFQACSVGSTNSPDLARSAIASGADPEGLDPANGTQTPLMRAAAHGSTRVVRVLLGAGACVDRCIGQCSALNYAAMSGNEEAARVLIEAGADVNLAPPTVDPTPLIEAASAGSVGVVRLLLLSGADPELADAAGRSPFEAARSVAVRRIVREACRARAERVHVHERLLTARGGNKAPV